MNAYQRAIQLVERNHSRDFNCIPTPFPSMSSYFPGIEMGTYNIITASSGVGKSQFTDYLFLHTPVEFYYNNPTKLRVKIFYYSLEMSPVMKALQCVAHKIFVDTGDRIGIKQMMAVNGRLDTKNLSILKDYEEYYEWFFKVVDLHGGPAFPYSIFKDLDAFYKANGTIHRRETVDHKFNSRTGIDEEVSRPQGVFDYYEPNDPDLFVICIVDHASLVSQQKGLDKRANMEKLSSYLMNLRNQFGLIVASIQQQAADQESKDNYRRPTLSGLGDNKAIQRDAENIFGLYDPYRHNERTLNGYPIMKMNQRYRELIYIKSRYGPSNIKTDLFYDGTVEQFYELPNAMLKDAASIAATQEWIRYAETLPINM